MISFNHVIKDPLGLHARPAGMLVKAATAYKANITINVNGQTADAKRIMAVMRLAAKVNDELEIIINGEDEQEASESLKAFLATNI